MGGSLQGVRAARDIRRRTDRRIPLMSESRNGDPVAQGDVAVFVDWENLKFSLAQRERRPNISALRSAAERFGRIVYARAYADWQDPVHSGDPAALYMAGLEPVYVLTKRYTETTGEIRIKNSVDVKLAADCIEASHTFLSVSTYIIVSGDHGFLHVVNTLRPHGKRVVVIGVSWTTAAQLTDQADVVLYYDVDVEPPIEDAGGVPPPAETTPQKLPPKLAEAAESAVRAINGQGESSGLDARKVADVLALVVEITKEYRAAGREFSVSLLGQELQKRMNPAEFQRVGKGRARIFAQVLESYGFVRVVSRDFVDWVFLPGESFEMATAAVPPSFDSPKYDYGGYVFSDIGEEVQDKLIVGVYDERRRPGTDWLTFKKIQQVAMNVTHRDEYATKNLVNNMLVIGVLRFDADRQGRDPETGTSYTFRTINLDLQHPDVRRALRLPISGSSVPAV